MPDTRKHRGPHPTDVKLFAATEWPRLREAVCDLSWLLTRGYSETAALKLVGDRYRLTERQRKAVQRSACSDTALQDRQRKQLQPQQLQTEMLWVDGFNVLTTVEAALAGGVILLARDGCFRDLASMHGSYRKVEETWPALQAVGTVLQRLGVTDATWLLDRPVSNSGRLKQLIRQCAEQAGWNWQVELVDNPDPLLAQTDAVVASADSVVLDRCRRWFNLARTVIEQSVSHFFLVDLSCKGKACEGKEPSC